MLKKITESIQLHLTDTAPDLGKDEKGTKAMAKLHARPSNQYRYEHYDPRS